MNIVVVESPAKAKTINKYLGRGYEVLASFGHVRDLPAKDGSVDPATDFRMVWEVDPRAQKRLNEIARALKSADKLILATDPDREGEAISWHLLEALKEKRALSGQAVERVVFNAITKQAVTEAMKHPREIDQALVDAYLARRALDYLVGFTLSPVLWRKLPGARSAGRVQSVALRLVCDRELEIEKFVPREYWSLVATLATPRGESFQARLVGADGQKIARLDIGAGAEAEAFKQALEQAAFSVASVEAKPTKRNPAPPFTTSTLQQEASRKLGFAARAYDARRPAPLRGHRDRRRGGRPDHLYAHRRRADRRRGRARRSGRRSGPTTARATCRTRPAAIRPRRRTRRRRTKRSGRPTSRGGRAMSRDSSIPTRPSCTNSSSSAPSRARWNRPSSSAPPSTSPRRWTRPGRACSICAPTAPWSRSTASSPCTRRAATKRPRTRSSAGCRR